jgi:hypothetical protein
MHRKNAATFDRGTFHNQVNQRLPGPPRAIASVVVVSTILPETLLITLQEPLAVSLYVSVVVA